MAKVGAQKAKKGPEQRHVMILFRAMPFFLQCTKTRQTSIDKTSCSAQSALAKGPAAESSTLNVWLTEVLIHETDCLLSS
eukprot:5993302-Amphidinium_carterae.1